MVSTERRFNGSMAVSTNEVDSVDSIEVQLPDAKFNCHSFRPSSLPNAGQKKQSTPGSENVFRRVSSVRPLLCQPVVAFTCVRPATVATVLRYVA